MEFTRTTNLDQVREILTCPAIYPLMGDDFAPPAEDFVVNEHPDIHYLIIGCWSLVGMYVLIPQNTVCWELHAALLPWSRASEKWEAARGLVPWLASNTPCKRLVASVPECNRAAIYYGTHGIGMHYVGHHPKAFMRNGRLQDLVILGRPVGG